MSKPLYIWGAGHFGAKAAWHYDKIGIKVKGFIDKNAKQIKTKLGFRVLEPSKALRGKNKRAQIIIAVQKGEAAREIIATLLLAGFKNIEMSPIMPFIHEYKKILQSLKPMPVKPIKLNNLTSYDVDAKKQIKNPLLRVAVRTYNNARFARSNLDGILMQRTNFPFEIYIHDDCSTDGTSDIMREYAQKYPNIIADIQPENYYSKDKKLHRKKIMSNLKNHNCKYVAMADGDDYWINPYKLQYQVDFLENNDDFSICSGGHLTCNHFKGGMETNLIDIGNSSGFEYDSYICNVLFCRQTFTLVFRANAIPEYEITRRYETWIDIHFIYHILKKGKGYYFPIIFGVYNAHSGGVWSRFSIERQLAAMCKLYEELYLKTKDEFIKKALYENLILWLEYKEHRFALSKDIINLYLKLSKEFKEIPNEPKKN
jgi:glycosyltransferase involved in cell wall biosynthesis